MPSSDATETCPASETSEHVGSEASLSIRWVHPDGAAAWMRLEDRELVLGRDAEGAGHLAGKEISRRHALVRRMGRLRTISDLGSTNGVFVNGRRVAEAPLVRGDVLRIGEFVGVVSAAPVPNQGAEFGEVAPGLFAGPVLSPILQDARRMAACSSLPIVVEGETGTGKERLARAIHLWSGRSGGFHALNCAALPEPLAEAQLFGYRRGSFTGADRDHDGYFRAADGGTLLLDEVVDLSLAVQAKLLRVLEQREVIPVGETRARPCDVLLVAAAQCPLADAVRCGRLRPDLQGRLSGLMVKLPPLRERREEIFPLFRFLATQRGAAWECSPRFIERLCLYDWPLNVRELDHMVANLALLHPDEPLLRRSHLPGSMASPSRGAATSGPPPQDTKEALIAALQSSQGNLSKAAAAIGISRQRAYRLLEQAEDVELESLRAQKLQGKPRSGSEKPGC